MLLLFTAQYFTHYHINKYFFLISCENVLVALAHLQRLHDLEKNYPTILKTILQKFQHSNRQYRHCQGHSRLSDRDVQIQDPECGILFNLRLLT